MTNPAISTVRHLVIFRFKPQAQAGQIEALTRQFRALSNKISGILGFEDGVNNSTEGLNNNFSHVFMVTFVDAQARDAYLPHPEHRAFVDFMNQLDIVEEVFVIDFSPSTGLG